MNDYEKLSPGAKLADKVWRYMLFSGRFDDSKPSELKDKFIIPIFGEEISKEVSDYYLNK